LAAEAESRSDRSRGKWENRRHAFLGTVLHRMICSRPYSGTPNVPCQQARTAESETECELLDGGSVSKPLARRDQNFPGATLSGSGNATSQCFSGSHREGKALPLGGCLAFRDRCTTRLDSQASTKNDAPKESVGNGAGARPARAGKREIATASEGPRDIGGVNTPSSASRLYTWGRAWLSRNSYRSPAVRAMKRCQRGLSGTPAAVSSKTGPRLSSCTAARGSRSARQSARAPPSSSA